MPNFGSFLRDYGNNEYYNGEEYYDGEQYYDQGGDYQAGSQGENLIQDSNQLYGSIDQTPAGDSDKYVCMVRDYNYLTVQCERVCCMGSIDPSQVNADSYQYCTRIT